MYYSFVSDNFHDFFTEYVPYGEESVLYFQEREFRRRFPTAFNRTTNASREGGKQVTIPRQNGVSWRVASAEDGSDLGMKGPHNSATQPKKANESEAKQNPREASAKDKTKVVEQAKKDVPSPKSAPAAPPKPVQKAPEPKPEPAKKEAVPTTPKPAAKQVTEPVEKPAPSVAPIDPLNIKGSNDPVVQDLVKIINNIITVVNADNSSSKYSPTINNAKEELSAVTDKILAVKDEAQKAADEKVKAAHDEFDTAAKELVHRLEKAMHEQELHWKDEFETEREKIAQSYQEKLKNETQKSQEVSEQRLRNELLEQAIELKRQFVADVKDRVESEREGRLGKLSELSSSISELEKLTGDLNTVVDANLKTQHLHVAVEAVRANLEKADRPRPFIRELAALKEIADNDPVVNAAIASINPSAYQRGVPSSAQLIDRFRKVAHEVRKASLLPEDAGVASHAASLVLSKLMFKKKGLVEGDDVESVLTRTETLLEEGNLDGAAREMNGLDGWAKTLSSDWLGEVRKVLEVQQALEVCIMIYLELFDFHLSPYFSAPLSPQNRSSRCNLLFLFRISFLSYLH